MSARDVIAGVAVDHQFIPVNHSSIGPEDHCRCGFRPRGWLEWSKHFADALIAAGVTMPAPVPPRCTGRIGHRRCILDTGHRGGHF